MYAQKPPFLELHNAVVRRAGSCILTIDSFELAEGEHLALLGPNGSGKSTFVKLITREMLPLYREEPPMRFRGCARAALAEVKRSLGIVSSSTQDQISVHLSAVDIVAGNLFGTLGIPEDAADAEGARDRAYAAMATLGVDSIAERDIMTLSTGQARRVLIARALIHDPDAFVFDEPCTGLDPEGMHYVRSSMRTLAQAGKSIVLVTHYPQDIIPEIRRLALLKDGTLFADGLKGDLLTDEVMTSLFDVPLRVQRMVAHPLREPHEPSNTAHEEEYFSLVSAY